MPARKAASRTSAGSDGDVPITCRQVSVEPNRTVGRVPEIRRSRSTVVGPTGAEPSSRIEPVAVSQD